jgi:hypothetical protein
VSFTRYNKVGAYNLFDSAILGILPDDDCFWTLPLAVAAMLVILAVALGFFSGPVRAVDLEPKSFPLTVLGVGIQIPVIVSFEAHTEGDLLLVQLKAQGDLADLQKNALNIARAIPVPKGNCDRNGVNPVVNSIDAASITPSADTAVISLKGRVTAWGCAHPAGITVKTILASDDIELMARVQIIVIDQKRIGLKLVAPVSVTAAGALTTEAVNLLAGDVSSSITASLQKALDASEAKTSLPNLPGFDPTIEHAAFAEDGPTLLVKADGSAKLTASTFSSLLAAMNP